MCLTISPAAILSCQYLHHHSTVAVAETHSTTLLGDPFHGIFKQDGSIVRVLNASTPVTGVDRVAILDLPSACIDPAWLGDSLVVQVDRYVATKSSEAAFMHRHMAEDHAVHDMVGTDLAEMPGVVFQLEDVVVALDQDLVPIETIKYAEALAVYDHIAEVIYFVLGAHTFIPARHHDLVHLFGRGEGSERRAIGSFKYGTGFFVTKVCVTHKPY